MPDPFGNPETPEANVLDFLGAQTPIFSKGQPALPVTGAAAVGTPQGPVGLAGGLRLVNPPTSQTGQAGPGTGQLALGAAEDLLKGVKFADLASTLFGTGPAAGALETPSGALTNVAPEILRGLQFPDFPASAVTDLPGIGIETGAGTANAIEGGAGGLTDTLAGALGIAPELAGSGLGAIGAIPGIVMAALSNEPNWEKAVDASLTGIGAGLAPFTYGISAIVTSIADLLVHLFNKPGEYLPKRQHAFGEAKTGLGELAGQYQQAAQTGDPAQILKALGTTEAGGHVYSGLNLPPNIATQLGLQVPKGAETVPVDWHSLDPAQFEQFLKIVEGQDPSVLNQWVTGSGDVPYLPGKQAQQAADQAAADARAVLDFMIAQQTQPQATGQVVQAPASPSAVSPGGGGADLAQEALAA